MPKLWNETIETHRREVREAIMDAASTLVAKHGLLSVTMSQIAEETGIGRATLYKYFSEVEEILHAWHERQITEHFEYLAEVRDRATGAGEQLKAVLEAYALIAHGTHGHGESDLAEFLHRVPDVLEVSIGHALISEALYAGLAATVRSYLALLQSPARMA